MWHQKQEGSEWARLNGDASDAERCRGSVIVSQIIFEQVLILALFYLFMRLRDRRHKKYWVLDFNIRLLVLLQQLKISIDLVIVTVIIGSLKGHQSGVDSVEDDTMLFDKILKDAVDDVDTEGGVKNDLEVL